MCVTSGNQTTVDAGCFQLELQPLNATSDVRSRVVIQARENMRRAGNHFDTIGHRHAGHLYRGPQIRGTVVDARDYVAVKVNQQSALTFPQTGGGPKTCFHFIDPARTSSSALTKPRLTVGLSGGPFGLLRETMQPPKVLRRQEKNELDVSAGWRGCQAATTRRNLHLFSSTSSRGVHFTQGWLPCDHLPRRFVV
jgi:hypothetical protein